MNQQILVIYKSVTGFTGQYAEWIAQKLNCPVLDLKETSAAVMSAYQTIIFGGRFHAGTVDGLKRAKALFEKSGYDAEMLKKLQTSCDCSSKAYIEPLIAYVVGEKDK